MFSAGLRCIREFTLCKLRRSIQNIQITTTITAVKVVTSAAVQASGLDAGGGGEAAAGAAAAAATSLESSTEMGEFLSGEPSAAGCSGGGDGVAAAAGRLVGRT